MFNDNEQITSFRDELINESRAGAASTGLGTCYCYLENVANYLIEAELILEYNPSYFEGIGKARKKFRVDGYAYDDFDQYLTLFIADFENGEERRLNKAGAEKSFLRLMNFLEASAETDLYQDVEISLPHSDLIDTIRENLKSFKKIQFILITDAERGANTLQLDSEEYQGIPIEKQIWDPGRIYEVCCSEEGSLVYKIDLRNYTPNGLPVLPIPSADSERYKSYVGVIPGQVLADIYDQFGSRILEGNVRSFLSTKVAVNKKIRNTILKEPEMFFAYNNGISITSTDVGLDVVGGMFHITSIENLQIINGGQTTASLTTAMIKDKADLSKISVQMKITEVSPSVSTADSDNLIQQISRSSNSQNKVSDADFFASHPFHRQMEQCSRIIKAPAVGGAQFETFWFYERARGQFQQEQMKLTAAQKNKYLTIHPKKQLITKTDLAKVQNCWRMAPQVVSKGAQTNFKNFADYIDEKWKKDSTEFNELYYKNTVSLMIMYKFMEAEIPRQPWYQGGYRANIIYYTLALFHYLIGVQNPGEDLDLSKIWIKQQVPEPIKKVLIELAELVLASITNPGNKVANVTQWCKRDSCWLEVKKIEYVLPPEIEDYFYTKADQTKQAKRAKKEQKLVDGINAQTKVCQYSANFWKDLATFAVKSHVVKTTSEANLLQKAIKIPKIIPNEFESKKLLHIVDRCVEDGFDIRVYE